MRRSGLRQAAPHRGLRWVGLSDGLRYTVAPPICFPSFLSEPISSCTPSRSRATAAFRSKMGSRRLKVSRAVASPFGQPISTVWMRPPSRDDSHRDGSPPLVAIALLSSSLSSHTASVAAYMRVCVAPTTPASPPPVCCSERVAWWRIRPPRSLASSSPVVRKSSSSSNSMRTTPR